MVSLREVGTFLPWTLTGSNSVIVPTSCRRIYSAVVAALGISQNSVAGHGAMNLPSNLLLGQSLGSGVTPPNDAKIGPIATKSVDGVAKSAEAATAGKDASSSVPSSKKAKAPRDSTSSLGPPKKKLLSASGGNGDPEDAAGIGTDSDHGVSTNKMSKRSNGWNERYNELVQYKRVHGNCNVPSGYRLNPALSQWVKRQRYQHKLKLNKEHTNLTPERYNMLQKLGFVWNAHEANWEESFSQLLKFKGEYGHCRVPTKYPANQQLSVWVKLQRRQYRLFKASKSSAATSTSPSEGDAKMAQTGDDINSNGGDDEQQQQKSHMTWERVTRLNDIGFEWDPRKLDSSKSKQKTKEMNIGDKADAGK